jgi:hypothetical protein
VQREVQAHPADPDWARLLDAERALEGEIATAEAAARGRVAAARAAAAAAAPDPAAVAVLAAAQERSDIERQRGELARIAADADAAIGALTQAPDALIDALAQLALGAALTDELPPAPR